MHTVNNPIPTNIQLHKRSAILELDYADDSNYKLSAEILRVYSPSAEVRGHGEGQEILQTGKINVKIDAIESVGNYAIKLFFNDGHHTGIYSWPYLYQLCTEQEQMWQKYLDKLKQANAHREPARRETLPQGSQAITIQPLPKGL